MMIPVMFASAFLNNTPIVALMIPILISWGRRCVSLFVFFFVFCFFWARGAAYLLVRWLC